MNKHPLNDLLEPVVEKLGYELVRVLTIGAKNPTLQVMIDRKDGKDISFPRPESYGEAAYRRHLNALNASIVAAVFAICWIVSYLTPYLGFYFEPLGQTGISFEMYGIIAAFFLLLYNGRRGYHAKWWIYFEWSFFPVHILLLAGIFALISL